MTLAVSWLVLVAVLAWPGSFCRNHLAILYGKLDHSHWPGAWAPVCPGVDMGAGASVAAGSPRCLSRHTGPDRSARRRCTGTGGGHGSGGGVAARG